MKGIKFIMMGLIFVGLTGFAYADKLSVDSSWDEILADDSLKVVFPVISVGNGKFVSYDHLFLDEDNLTTGKTFERATAYTMTGADNDSTVTQTAVVEEVASIEYIKEVCEETGTKPSWKESYVGPLVCYPVEGEHKTTVPVSVYKKAMNMKGSYNDNKQDRDIFLFTKEYTVPVYADIDEGMN